MGNTDASTGLPDARRETLNRLRQLADRLFSASPIGREIPWTIVMLGGCVVTALLFNHMYRKEADRFQEEFINRSKERFHAVKQGVSEKVSSLSLVTRFFEASDQVRASEFRVLVDGVLQTHPDIVSLEWIPLIETARLETFRSEQGQEADPGIHLSETVRRPRPDLEHTALPLLFESPPHTSDLAPLSDMREHPDREAALLKAWERGRPTAILPVTSSGSEERHRVDLLFFAPVFAPEQPTTPDRSRTTVGFVGMRVDAQQMVEETLANLRYGWVDVTVRCQTGSMKAPTLVHVHTSTTASTGPRRPNADLSPAGPVVEDFFSMAGCRWDIECQASPNLLARFNQNDSLMLLVASGLLTILSTIYVRALTQTARRTRLEVQERTAELKQSNELLRHEIRERVVAVRALKAAETRYRGIFEHAPNGMFRTSMNGTLSVANPAFARLCGFHSPQQLLDAVDTLPASLLAHPSDWDEIQAELRECGEIHDREIRIRQQDGRSIWVSATIRTTMNVEDGRTLLEGTLIDISLRKRAEEQNGRLEDQLRQAQKMEALGTLAGGIAHDFNNILTAIMGHGELMSMGLERDEKHRTNVQGILSGAARAKALVRQILAFSCAQESEHAPVHLSPLLEEATQLLRASLPTTIEIEFASDASWDLVMADATQIHQVIMNLGTNAAQAMPDRHGTVRIHLVERSLDTERTAATGLPPGDYLAIAVSDDGQGMTPDLVDRIFEPFFTTKAVGQGTGLGLSVVHGIVQSHAGGILVRSQPGQGTSFEILLPKATEKASEQAAPSDDLRQGNNESILLVDDETQVVEVMEGVLSLMGYRVTACSSSTAALQQFMETPEAFDVVVTDYTMPHLTGLELANRIRLLNPSVPIILCSGYAPGISGTQLQAIGRCHMAAKPLEPTRLSRMIQKILKSPGANPKWETALIRAGE